MKWFFSRYYSFKIRLMHFYHARIKNKKTGLKQKLIEKNRTRWLDMGASGSFTEGFHFADLYPVSEAKPELRNRYFQFNATSEFTDEELDPMGKFDLIRMQHVFEHFTPEGAEIALKNCARLLNKGGYLLVSTPDLKIFVERYRRNCLDVSWDFASWAESRIKKNSPQSFYFSIFSHSVLHQPHLWCYDKEGLTYSINKTGEFEEIRHLSIYNKLAEIPFTHNRPWEDVCVMARKK